MVDHSGDGAGALSERTIELQRPRKKVVSAEMGRMVLRDIHSARRARWNSIQGSRHHSGGRATAAVTSRGVNAADLRVP